MKKHIAMNFSNPNTLDGEKPYRAHCDFTLRDDAVIDVYKCPVVAELQTNNVDIRVVFHVGDEVFVFQNPDSSLKHFYDKTVFGNMCKICPNKHRGGR